MTPEQQVDAVKAALAEAGYPDAYVVWGDDRPYLGMDENVPMDVWWRARALTVFPLRPHAPCWPCQEAYCLGLSAQSQTCTHDWRSEPWPPVPERVP